MLDKAWLTAAAAVRYEAFVTSPIGFCKVLKRLIVDKSLVAILPMPKYF